MAAFLLVNKVWSPQYSLWLVPLAVLALPRWRLLLAWMLVDALVWVPRMFYYLTPADKGLPPDCVPRRGAGPGRRGGGAVRAGGALGPAASGRLDPEEDPRLAGRAAGARATGGHRGHRS